jgi:hypothetical protein
MMAASAGVQATRQYQNTLRLYAPLKMDHDLKHGYFMAD